jgi:eukaryotic-like serine/threonine-protein kinase
MSPQQTIAHYRITIKLGEGGMGAVYRATDTKLHRDVALKVLPDAFANDPDRMARFQREAQVLASLNHPQIAAIYGVEDRALVLELVPGATLAERIAQGPIPLEEALPLASQIAEALEYAHERGVVHRDLKPVICDKTRRSTREKTWDFAFGAGISAFVLAGGQARCNRRRLLRDARCSLAARAHHQNTYPTLISPCRTCTNREHG